MDSNCFDAGAFEWHPRRETKHRYILKKFHFISSQKENWDSKKLRYEYKFYVHRHKIPLLRNIILTKLRLDPNVNPKKKHYTVRSIYFDSIELKHYYEKIGGLKHRKKVRLRGYDYDPNSTVFFEVKRKFEEPGIKNRYSTSYYEALQMIKERTISTDNDDLNKFFYQFTIFFIS